MLSRVTRIPVASVEPTLLQIEYPINQSNNFLDLFDTKNPCSEILQGSECKNYGIHVSSNGLVFATISAYNCHHNLVLRPDDIWLAIMTQFSFYINANAEKYRKFFVNFEGQKRLSVTVPGSLRTASYDTIVKLLIEEIHKNLTDSKIKEWILPNFTTTTKTDKMSAGIVFMGTMKKYFQYYCTLLCGIPNIFLQGSLEDWKEIYHRVEKLKEYDLDMWVNMLRPILQEFINAKKGIINTSFWSKICHYNGGSGSPEISGWITVFCAFSSDGVWQDDEIQQFKRKVYSKNNSSEEVIHPMVKNRLSFEKFRQILSKKKKPTVTEVQSMTHAPSGFWFDVNRLSPGIVEADLLVNDNGTEYDTVLLAGSLGINIEKVTLKPAIGWMIGLRKEQNIKIKD